MALRIPSLPVWKIIVSFLLFVSVVIIFSGFYVFNLGNDIDAVSYTHLTQPTNREV